MRAGAGAFGEDVVEDRPVGPAPGVFSVGGLVGVACQVGQAELVVLADLHAPKPREIRFDLIVGRPVRGAVGVLMVDPTHRG